jgi:outer membrane protein assembly factor BamB
VLSGVVSFSTFAGRTYADDARTGRILWQFDDGRYSPVTTWGDMLILTGKSTLYGMRTAP